MKCRGGAVPPASLLTFSGDFDDYEEYREAFSVWCSAREAWEDQHPGQYLPRGQVLAEAPGTVADHIGLPHSGVWARASGEDRMRCRVHGLTADQH